jgi:hypothetical protein
VKILVCEAGNAEREVPLGGRWRRSRALQGRGILPRGKRYAGSARLR